MKEVNVKSYNKRDLLVFCSFILIIGVAGVVGGIALILNAINFPDGSLLWKIILGAVLCLVGAVTLLFGIIMMIVAKSTIDTKGSIKLDNPVKGTINMNKCPHCYREIEEDAEFCNHCGVKLQNGVVCKCGQVNPVDSDFCKKCGAKLKK